MPNVVIAGGRDYRFDDRDVEFLDKLHKMINIEKVLCGGASGADQDGAEWAEERGIKVSYYLADRHRYGKGAGPRRNAEMARNADFVVLFPGGKGTTNMRKQAEESNCVVIDVEESQSGIFREKEGE